MKARIVDPGLAQVLHGFEMEKSRRPAPKMVKKQETGRRRMDPAEREEEIIASAIKFFAQHGFDGSTRELASSIGITQPLLYRYFPSKEALLERVYEKIFVNPWRKQWESELRDRNIPLEARLIKFYQEYAEIILSYEWIRLFMFSGLKGLDFNTRYLRFLRKAAFEPIVREIKAGSSPASAKPVTDEEIEIVWALHASIFYIGVRKFIYGMPVPADLNADLCLKVKAFLHGAAHAFAAAQPPSHP